jgi:hypothetical protein
MVLPLGAPGRRCPWRPEPPRASPLGRSTAPTPLPQGEGVPVVRLNGQRSRGEGGGRGRGRAGRSAPMSRRAALHQADVGMKIADR